MDLEFLGGCGCKLVLYLYDESYFWEKLICAFSGMILMLRCKNIYPTFDDLHYDYCILVLFKQWFFYSVVGLFYSSKVFSVLQKGRIVICEKYFNILQKLFNLIDKKYFSIL